MTVVADSMVDRVIERILSNMEDNEGKIFVYEVNEVIDINSKRRGESAL
jgi:nitrogen regulatory protein PII